MAAAFHEVRFPLALALAGSGGPERKTDIVVTGSGREERTARWFHARRKYDAGSGVRTLASLAEVLAFFEERRGRLYGFRFRDRVDWKSCAPDKPVSPSDQVIGTGDGATSRFQLTKTYGAIYSPYVRPITKPVAGSVKLQVGTVNAVEGVAFDVDVSSGQVVFRGSAIPAAGAIIRAGFEFDVPVRFESDELMVDYEAFIAGQIPHIPLIEIIP